MSSIFNPIREALYSKMLETNEAMTYEQIKKKFNLSGFEYGHLMRLIMEGRVEKIQDGNLFVYKAIPD